MTKSNLAVPQSYEKRESPGLSVVFASDEQYVPHLATAVTSLLETNREIIDRIFVITQSSATHAFRRFTQDILARYGVEVEPCPLDPSILEGLFVSGHVSQATYNRFLIGHLIPSEVDYVLYFDSDLIVVGDLSPLLRTLQVTGLNANWVVSAVARDNPYHLKQFGHSGSKYFNAGVLLVNVIEWRRRLVAENLFETAHNLFGRLHLWDQDVLNLVLEDSWAELPGEFNETALTRRDEDSVVVHFVGGTKPWMWGSNHPYRSEYDRFRSLTPYWPYRKSGLGRYLRKRFVPRGLQKPRKLVKRSVRLLRRKIGRLLGR